MYHLPPLQSPKKSDTRKQTNRFITEMEPWSIARNLRNEKPEEQLRLKALMGRTIYVTAETLRNMGILLQPFIPEKAKHMLDVLGVSDEKRTFEFLGLGMDPTYGEPRRDPGRSAHDGLFPPLEVET